MEQMRVRGNGGMRGKSRKEWLVLRVPCCVNFWRSGLTNSPFEYFGQITAAINHASDLYAVGGGNVKDEVTTNRVGPNIGAQVRSQSADVGKIGQKIKYLIEIIKKPMGCHRI
jgi:hypothetical protein